MKIIPGKYNAKIKDYGLVQSKSGAVQVKVVFALEGEGAPDFSYFGNLGTAQQQEFTTKTLMTLGANASNIDKVEQGLAGGVLNTSKTFELVIEDRQHAGKTYTQIKYINDLSAKPAQNFIKGSNSLSVLKGQAAKIAAENGMTLDSSKANDSLPF